MEKLVLGLSTFGLGFGTVFVGLICLILIIKLMSLVFTGLNAKKAAAQEAQMQRYLQDVADKTLSQNLKELESDGLINRKMYPQVPPKVEYTLTARGQSLMKILDQLCVWGQENRSWKDR